MSDKETLPADRVPTKPVTEVSSDRITYIHDRELGKIATGRLWMPSEIDIDHFNKFILTSE